MNNLTDEMNQIVKEEGTRIYLDLKKKFPNPSTRDIDLRFNSLCVALICHRLQHVSKEKYDFFLELVINVLNKND